MEKDFYLDRRWLASYFEKDWFDHVLAQGQIDASFFEFAPFPASLLYSDHHERVADFLSKALSDAVPQRMLEIGSSLGRGFFEICSRLPSLRSATLVEPSALLADAYSRLFAGGSHRYPVLKGNLELSEVEFDSTRIREATRNVDAKLIRSSHEQLNSDLGLYDLVVCFNVLDQCRAPLELVRYLKERTHPGGMLAVSCTYQWSDTYLGTNEAPFRNLRELLDDDFTLLSDDNLGFRSRRFERHWVGFLSQVVTFRKRS